MKTKTHKKDKIDIITLGCSKNRVDSEVLLTQLKGNELVATHEAYKGNIVVINTCGFIDRAKQESIETILDYADKKQRGKIDKLYVTGCLSERYKQNLEEEIPEVDAFFGTMELIPLLEKLGANYKHDLIGERNLTTPSHYAYLKISEGCNRTCSFCAIPLMRGKHVSKPIEAIINEAKNLVRNGVKEIMLIAQELTYYGLDIYKKRKLDDLLHQLADVEGLEWIRLHYAYPSNFPLEILDVMKAHSNICNYIDMPLQHASDSVLSHMHRQITQKDMRELIDKIRNKIDNVAIRTTMLVGYPNETEQDFQILCDFVEQQRFDRLGVFQYSHEEDTGAHAAIDGIDDETKEERAAILMELQQGISYELNQEKIGKTYKVLIDRKEGESWIGRTEFDSPEVDNEVIIDASSSYARIGDFANVLITDATEFDLTGQLV
jgi:ribosomal protein S12 methylthiotransferase